MLLSPLLNLQLRSKLCCCLKQIRSIRPSIKVSKDKFQLTLDVKNFDKDELRVKARPEHVIIEGKQERQTKRGFVLRRFVRKFKLPQGVNPQCIQSNLSADGILTIKAAIKPCEKNLPCETLIPISSTEVNKDDPCFVPTPDTRCSAAGDCKPGDKKPT